MALKPSVWASKRPFGVGLQRPNNFGEVFRAAWASRRRPRYAWRILNEGCCDGCALGTTGMRDWTLDGTHLCNVRLRLLPLNLLGPMAAGTLDDAAALERLDGQALRALGRLDRPYVRHRGEPGFTPTGWDAALDLIAARLRTTDPARVAAFLTSRGMPNESYYASQKAMRALGVASIDSAARMCHAPSTIALKAAIGVGATTCSYHDVEQADLVVFVGANPANNQPVFMKYLHHARERGARMVGVNPYREPGMERYWIPSTPQSAVFGTRFVERWFQVGSGGDTAFLVGTMKVLLERGHVHRAFVEQATTRFDDLRAACDATTFEDLEAGCGLPRAEMEAFAALVHEADRGVLVWSMGATQTAHGEDTVRAVVDLGLTQGWVGREGCGLMPIRGHSGVQGGAEMGCYASALPGGDPVDEEHAAAWGRRWGFPVPTSPARTVAEMVDAADAGELDVLLASGGNFRETLPDPAHVARALGRVGLRVHADLVTSSQMLVEPADAVVLLPMQTRYELEGGCTQTSTERRVIFSPHVPGTEVREARAEWDVFGDLAARVRPDLAGRVRFASTAAVRAEIGALVPRYAGIEHLHRQGDHLQLDGARIGEGWTFPTPDGRARFAGVVPTLGDNVAQTVADGRLRLTTRRGKQFNSMVQERTDALNGARRDDVLLAAADLKRLRLSEGAPVLVRSAHGELRGTARRAPIRAGDAQAHWPEANVLLDPAARSAESAVPDYGVLVEVTAV